MRGCDKSFRTSLAKYDGANFAFLDAQNTVDSARRFCGFDVEMSLDVEGMF